MSCIIRRSFPQVYEMEHPQNGTYWLVFARRKKFGFNERKTFSTKARALEHAIGIEQNLLKFGAQTDVPKEKGDIVCVNCFSFNPPSNRE